MRNPKTGYKDGCNGMPRIKEKLEKVKEKNSSCLYFALCALAYFSILTTFKK